MKSIPKNKNRRFLLWIFNLFLVSFLVVIHVRLYKYAFDDAYIHFRVARNLFETGNPYYNANDMLKVSTSSGWIVFLTILFGVMNLFKVESNFPLFISVTNALISLGGLYIYTKIVEILLKNQLSIPKKLLFQISFAALLLPSSIGLMETPLALLVAGLGIYFLLFSKPLGFALLGIAIYIRLELSILIILIILFVIVQKQFQPYQIIGYSIFGFIPLVFYDLYFFHTIMPHSIIAKSIMYPLTISSTLGYLLDSFSIIESHGNPVYLFIISITFFPAVIMTTWVAIRERKILKSLWPMLFSLWSLGIIGAYITGHALIFDWYTPLYMIPILIASFICAFMIEYPRNIIIKIPLFVLFLLSVSSIVKAFYASVYNPGDFVLFEGGSRVKTYLEVGRILYDEYPNATLLSSEIGGLGYSFKGKILDAAGLASPDALAFQPVKIGHLGSIPPEYVRLTMPDIIVSYDIYAEALLSNDIINQYNVIAIPAYLPEDAIYSKSNVIMGSEYLRVYIHKNLPISKKIYALGK